LKGKHIHHIDGNPLNNDPSNLAIITPEEHRRIPKKMRLTEEERIGETKRMIWIDLEYWQKMQDTQKEVGIPVAEQVRRILRKHFAGQVSTIGELTKSGPAPKGE